ncbi:sperm acrosome membrane-associated protein 6 [Poecile atricapillus]|uniref:sperm acrosome membrane-associated protein 6 n=1 Tax=Poecile atricapillus TaxID=48891 RepID=UPI002739DC99|nr:sperm acrosome membrane-associated protein 6 [Poecile atricapillus]
MGWWFVALMLMLVPWHPRNPGLWLWVLMSCLPEVHPCLLCFGPPLQRARLCRDITGAFANNPELKECHEALVEAAQPLASVTVGSGQREELREIVMDAMFFLEEQRGKSEQNEGRCMKVYGDQGEGTLSYLNIWDTPEPLNETLQEAVNTIWTKLNQLGKVPACIPPCGFQPAARVFQCATCSLVDCQFALDCPVQDLWTYTDETIVLRCNVPFHTPSSLPVTWMFAPNLRTQDMTLFKELKGNPEKPFSLTIEEPAPGTVACRLGEPSKPIIRKFFYLNVSEGSVEEEKGLQAVFSTVLHRLHDKTPVPHTPTMGLALAAGSMAFILLLM